MNSSAAETNAGAGCEFQENLEFLRQIDFFAGLPIETLKVFAYLCARETYQPGDRLFSQDEDDGQAFYLISGQTMLTHAVDGGEIDVRAFSSGAFLGSLALLGSMPRLFSLKAVEPVECLVLTREKFSKSIEQFPDLVPRMFNTIVVGILRWEKRLVEEMAARGVSVEEIAGISAM
ncbi:MAG: Crp/Fnr family transcriptional regulator [Desulfobacterales bacterium]|nr:Crp/Fnr family transcriptional regulator [Desulfobacterales bacterium]MDJ0856561.1 Crp/Fnr family transcriptional regulator [Desulfobacterales bacterium]MDJ0888610.1 Crp/Fnr family transcriptional regulator [Desulfobacterales bacterium]MDJ0990838.1 Crp/Fnr family transcriptional regulator [Desulfobacterales bacterium]